MKAYNKNTANFMQSSLHDVLNSFLNGGFSYKGFALYPLIKDVSAENKKRLYVIANDLNIRTIGKGHLNSVNFAAALCEIYKKISFNGRIAKAAEKKPARIFDLSQYPKEDMQYLKPIEYIRKVADEKLKKFAAGFYIHGSISTNDYIKGWSDVDTLIILKSSVFEAPKNLLEIRDILYGLRANFCSVDPLQHHGVMVVTEHDLGYYPEVFLPIDALNCSKSLMSDDKTIKFNIRDSKEEAMLKLNWVMGYFKSLEPRKAKNSYELKFMLHLAALFPALYLEAKGIYLYKKFTFELAEKDFSEEDWKPIKYAEKTRKEWLIKGSMPFLGGISKINPVLAYRLNSLYIDLIGGIKNKVDVKLIVEGMGNLADKGKFY